MLSIIFIIRQQRKTNIINPTKNRKPSNHHLLYISILSTKLLDLGEHHFLETVTYGADKLIENITLNKRCFANCINNLSMFINV